MRWKIILGLSFGLVLLFTVWGLGWGNPYYAPDLLAGGAAARPFAYRVLAPAMLWLILRVGAPVKEAAVLLNTGSLAAFLVGMRSLVHSGGSCVRERWPSCCWVSCHSCCG